MNSFSWSQRIALIHYFPLEVNGGRFLSFLVAFRNTATRRHSEIKQNRSTTKQDFSGEALSKQNIKDWLTSLSCSSSRATTEWSAIFAFGVCRNIRNVKLNNFVFQHAVFCHVCHCSLCVISYYCYDGQRKRIIIDFYFWYWFTSTVHFLL